MIYTKILFNEYSVLKWLLLVTKRIGEIHILFVSFEKIPSKDV